MLKGPMDVVNSLKGFDEGSRILAAGTPLNLRALLPNKSAVSREEDIDFDREKIIRLTRSNSGNPYRKKRDVKRQEGQVNKERRMEETY